MISYSIELETLRIKLLLIRGRTWPTWTINQLYSITSVVEKDNYRTMTIDIKVSSNRLVFSNVGKTQDETIIKDGKILNDQGIIIQQLWANAVLLENEQINKVAAFYPVYTEDNIKYSQKHNIVLSEKRNQLDFYYNGDWVFEFEQPFFIWYNRLLLQSFSDVNSQFKQLHLGIGDNDRLSQLSNLMNQLND
jgi:hypothetical protein